jgi:hypothetical protein
MTLVLTGRLGLDPELLDLPSLIGVLDDGAAVRSRRQDAPLGERSSSTTAAPSGRSR